MNSKYGNFPKEQIHAHKKTIQNSIFKLLYMREEKDPNLDRYFAGLLWKLSGYNQIFSNQTVVLDLLAILAQARDEALKEDYDHAAYRKAILDATSLVDHIKEDDVDESREL